MKTELLTIVLVVSLTTPGPQSGRMRQQERSETPASAAERSLTLDSSRPVLVNMTPEDRQACGLNKLTEEELNRLDRWFLTLLVKLQSLPSAQTLTFERPEAGRASDEAWQQWEAQVRQLQSRLSTINREAMQMTFDLDRVRLAASRGDMSGVYSAIVGLESALRRIQQASQ